MTYHPRRHCNSRLVKGGHFVGQGLAVGNHTVVCQRSKRRSYFIPMNKVRMILNYTWIPDRPFLEFLCEIIIPRESVGAHLALFKLNALKVVCFERFQNPKRRSILYIKPWVRLTVSLVNVTLICENNFTKQKILYFIDGPIFLIGSYYQDYALIASLSCENMSPRATSATLKGNGSRYLYLDQVKASIGDLTAVLQSPDQDMSETNFRFNTHLPNKPYGHLNFTDYTNTEPDSTSESVLANLNLPSDGRHFHIMYWLQRRSWKFLSIPRLVFHINKFEMVSFQDGCNTGGIFIGEKHSTIASYCSRAGVTFLNSTTEKGGILFGISPLLIILKGYSFFANIQLNISISYENCLGITNICDKLGDNSPIFPLKCSDADIPCRYVVPEPCIEIVRLPSDGLLDYSKACQFMTNVIHYIPGYTDFTNSVFIAFTVDGHLELKQDLANLQEEVLPMINLEYLTGSQYFAMFPFRYPRLQLNRKYRIWSRDTITNIKNTYPWLGMGHWIRMIRVPGCHTQTISLQPLEVVHIWGGCGDLQMTSVAGQATILIPNSVFVARRGAMGLSEVHQFLYISFVLLETHPMPDYRAKGLLFNAALQWSFLGNLQKRIVYTRRRHLQLKTFSQYTSQEFSIALEWSISLSKLLFHYLRRIPVAKKYFHSYIRDFIDTTNWMGDKQPEMCVG